MMIPTPAAHDAYQTLTHARALVVQAAKAVRDQGAPIEDLFAMVHAAEIAERKFTAAMAAAQVP